MFLKKVTPQKELLESTIPTFIPVPLLYKDTKKIFKSLETK